MVSVIIHALIFLILEIMFLAGTSTPKCLNLKVIPFRKLKQHVGRFCMNFRYSLNFAAIIFPAPPLPADDPLLQAEIESV